MNLISFYLYIIYLSYKRILILRIYRNYYEIKIIGYGIANKVFSIIPYLNVGWRAEH